MGVSFQELIAVKTHPVIMKFMVPLSLLIVSMAKGQEDIDAASLNAILPAGYTKVCEDGETPRGAEPRGKRQIGGDGPPPCWSIVDSDFDRTKCSSFEGTCQKPNPTLVAVKTPCASSFPMLENGSSWAVPMAGAELTIVVISTLEANVTLPDLWPLFSPPLSVPLIVRPLRTRMTCLLLEQN